MSNFSVILDFLGLSSPEAASLLGVEEAEIARWRSTHDSPPLAVWQQLVRMVDQIRLTAEEVAKSADLDHISSDDLNRIALAVPGQDNAPAGPRRAATALALTTLARVFV